MQVRNVYIPKPAFLLFYLARAKTRGNQRFPRDAWLDVLKGESQNTRKWNISEYKLGSVLYILLNKGT